MQTKDKVIVITGAASGFGAAAAKKFVDNGGKVVLGDIQEDLGRSIAEKLGDNAVFAACDVTKESNMEGLINLALEKFGKLDVMFNNAGVIGAVGPIDTTPSEEWKATLDILLNSVFYGTKHAARVMKEQKSGCIINTASTAAVMGGLGPHAYAAAKHAVVGLTKNTASELCRWGIRVNAIAPGAMATALVSNFFTGNPGAIDQTLQILGENSPLPGRPGTAEDVADAVVWLASDASSYINGHTLVIDAGVTVGAGTEVPPMAAEYKPMFREGGKSGL